MNQTRKKGSGGARPGAGAKKKTRLYSEAVKRRYQKAAKKIEQETGMTVEEHFLRMAIDPDVQPAARAAFAKLYNEALLVKESEQTINDNRQGPTIALPPTMERPAAVENRKEAETYQLNG